ncbi:MULTISPECIES: helix-turn-helix domain-containing protein [unclassified Pseudomonas]|uniref:helix-turn-helix domain-containing protein n=1 Tax=unclassified Pseudomonas TaxID=196821 RepID=UPI000C88DA9E|nr:MULTISPECIES: helix-turn-helix domain-containing protein [unclassified Pseudomonas]MBJ2322001.1 helix-turn-helix domain-containing protein [Pseudomonas fluorescens]PMZ68001.1 AraC family transcriptional regulator [Pseudomonas sp. GW247-3R2A]PMY63071.1 AraC family transcriptional regulator [Pseudomonas sp. MPR-R3A]PMY95505.1 AraC family transcriptional regulator [Pseudomonas sp. FW305-124]PNA88022.1 AraC family transcriptional regulator [Pseudomonas sp. FW300-E2]
MTQATALRVQAFATGDVAAQCSATPGWVQQYQQMSPGHFAGRVRYLDLHGVQVYEECMNTRVEQHFNAPAGALAFCFDASDNALYLLNGESRNTWITPVNYREVAVVFGPQFVQRHGLDMAKLEGLFMAPLSCQQNALFTRWLSGTLTRLSALTDPISRDALTQQLLDDCLFILDNACVCLDGSSLQKRNEERQLMARIGEWAADAPDETANLLELAQIAGVPLRQLQQGFKTYTGISPAQWLRLRRLNGARRELLSTTDTTVAEVAMNWSFWHLGRFSNSYRALFQELPSETLKRSS